MAGIWYVTMACEGLEMGWRFISTRLNPLLAECAPGLAIDAEPVQSNDSMPDAMSLFRRALPGLRTLKDLPVSDREIVPWTLGYVNDDGNYRYDVSVVDNWGQIDPGVFDLLRTRRRNWKLERWARFIVAPIQKHMAETRVELANLSLQFGAQGRSEDIPGELQSQKGVSLVDAAMFFEGNDDQAAHALVRRWHDLKVIKAVPIGKCPIDGRARLYGLLVRP